MDSPNDEIKAENIILLNDAEILERFESRAEYLRHAALRIFGEGTLGMRLFESSRHFYEDVDAVSVSQIIMLASSVIV